ncbi:MAG: CPBP family intramembrane glutamic endopeptidase [Acidobacteriota bacterium]
MRGPRLVALAVGTQSALVAAAVGGGLLAGVPVTWGEPVRGLLLGGLAAAGLAGANLALLRVPVSGWWLVDGVRHVYRDVLVPLFGRLSRPGLVVVGLSAGVGEEWLFRGLLQPLTGWVAASLLFGLAHVASPRMLAFGVWAACMGLALGGLAIVAGGVIAPMVAHGVYDVLALAYIRRDASRPPTGEAGGGGRS